MNRAPRLNFIILEKYLFFPILIFRHFYCIGRCTAPVIATPFPFRLFLFHYDFVNLFFDYRNIPNIRFLRKRPTILSHPTYKRGCRHKFKTP